MPATPSTVEPASEQLSARTEGRQLVAAAACQPCADDASRVTPGAEPRPRRECCQDRPPDGDEHLLPLVHLVRADYKTLPGKRMTAMASPRRQGRLRARSLVIWPSTAGMCLEAHEKEKREYGLSAGDPCGANCRDGPRVARTLGAEALATLLQSAWPAGGHRQEAPRAGTRPAPRSLLIAPIHHDHLSLP
jgi:hypothetical protein